MGGRRRRIKSILAILQVIKNGPFIIIEPKANGLDAARGALADALSTEKRWRAATI